MSASVCTFIEIAPEVLAAMAEASDRTPTLYFSRHWSVRKFFWMRLRLINRHLASLLRANDGNCLDFGGGGGVFLPTLSLFFKSVTCLDLDISVARKVVDRFELSNVQLVQADIADAHLDGAPFNAIVAADVLEHFRDLGVPVRALRRWLGNDGILVTSLPAENVLYVALRKLFGIKKPADHYHTAVEVEAYLAGHGFEPVRRSFVPLYIPLLPLFAVTAWRIRPEN